MAKTFPILGYMVITLLQQIIPAEVVSKPDFFYYLFQTSIAGILFGVWRITQKSSVKQQQEQSEQTGKQFSQIFQQLKDINKEAMDQNNRILERMFSFMQTTLSEDIKYKSLIAESMSRFEAALSNHIRGN